MTVNLNTLEDLFTTVMCTGSRNQPRQQVLGHASQRALAMDALLYGQLFDDWRLWDIANYLRLPTEGNFVVIAAAVGAAGVEPLLEIESKLSTLDVYSAWRLVPGLQVGIAHIGSDRRLDKIVALLSRATADPVGVSAPFDGLRNVPHALHCAKVSLRGYRTRTTNVVVFDGSILATAAISAPGAMVNSTAATLDGFARMSPEERDTLFETFRAWQDSGASVRATADLLFCHPNTVRYRLRRIEQCTGKSLSRPRDLVELCLALEVHRRLL
jgi:hypothetical protein